MNYCNERLVQPSLYVPCTSLRVAMVTYRYVSSLQAVNQKKLEKVDAKLKVKLEKKAQKDQLSSAAAAEKG